MFTGGRQALWEEKLGLAPKFAGNAATRWGTRQEADALLRQAATDAHAQRYCRKEKKRKENQIKSN